MSQQGESRLLARAVASFASATFLSRIVGFVRDMVIAMFFGAGHRADAFFIAFSILRCSGGFLPREPFRPLLFPSSPKP